MVVVALVLDGIPQSSTKKEENLFSLEKKLTWSKNSSVKRNKQTNKKQTNKRISEKGDKQRNRKKCVMTMAHSSSKPLSLNAYQTPAEFKAYRLNRAEQSRLDTARTYLTRQERTFHKDFNTSRIKVETNYMRRLSVADSPVVMSSAGSMTPSSPYSPWSASTTPRTVSAVSFRRSSDIPQSSYSARRGSLWSLPESQQRGRSLHRRRLTYGGGLAGLGVQSRARSLGSRGSVSISDKNSACEFCDRLSDLVESHAQECRHAPAGSALQNGEGPPRLERNLLEVPHANEAIGHGLNVKLAAERAKSAVTFDTTDSSSFSVPSTLIDVPAVTVENSNSPMSSNTALSGVEDDALKENQSKRRGMKSKSAGHFRRFSNTAPGIRSNGISNGVHTVDNISTNNALSTNDVTENVNGVDPGGASDTTHPEHMQIVSEHAGKNDRRVSIMKPSSPAVPIRTHTPEPNTNLLLPEHHDEVKNFADIILEHAKHHCPAGEAESLRRNSAAIGSYRENSVAFGDLRRKSETVGEPMLQGRVSQFLNQQNDFNKRFPLKRHEVQSLECARPDLLHASRAREKSEKQVSIRKAKMVSEVLEKLGLEQNDVMADDKKCTPRFK